MYIDGHERSDVVKYQTEFLARWREYKKRMVFYDNDRSVTSTPNGFLVPQGPHFRLILVTHDESIFYENDRQKSKWLHADETHKPEHKGEGQSIMVSDFLTIEWGRLQDEYEYVSQFSYFYIGTI